MVNRLRGYEEAVSDFGIAQSISQQSKDFHLPVRESRRVFLSARPWAAWNAANARCAQGLPYPIGCRACSESFKNLKRRVPRRFVPVCQRHRLFVGAAEFSPGLGGSAPV